jgi:hypothetical protein
VRGTSEDEMISLVQLEHPNRGRVIASVEEDRLRVLSDYKTAHALAQEAIARRQRLAELLRGARSQESLDYAPVHAGKTDWKFLPPFDHPEEPARCLVTGTGLTHKASAERRQAMHASSTAPVTDSMRMYQWGLEGGRPKPGQTGVQPEWFYKGCGTVLRAHREPLEVPPFGLDGGEEAEVAGVYLIDPAGHPRRVGFALANEFSDHKMEKQNYLCLAHSKLRTCALGPELILDSDFDNARGTVSVLRAGKALWTKAFATGENNMSHTVANLEHHHFKYPAHRRPGDVHIHFFGADVFSFGDGLELQDGDIMEIDLPGFGRALRNLLSIDRTPEKSASAEPI